MNKLNLKLAKSLSEGIRIYAESKGVNVVVAVCNAEGNPITVDVMDGAFIISYQVAMKKAYTSVGVKMSTEDLGNAVKKGGVLEGLHDERLIFFGGGAPLYIDGELVGGFGVSGGTVEEDSGFAKFGVELFKQLIK
ncbi:MAG: heme-binding protein [Clostridia bacterium]|nr:heme-binding protein [Clostridia bacterium]